LAARLHNTTPLLGLEIPYVERFHLPFEQELHRSLDELQEGSILTRPGQHTLSELILPQRETLLALLARLHELQRYAQKLDPPMVLVHTDMHGGNLIRSKEGELFVVDWEGAMLAPAEHDLFMFVSAGFGAMLAEYHQTANEPHLFPELFAYYIYRRNLEDIAYFLLSILHENTSDEQDQVELGYLQQDCLESWSSIESSIRSAQEQLLEVTP
jgi:thiamine kinase-like enzyme